MEKNNNELLLSLAQTALQFKKAVQVRFERDPSLIQKAAESLGETEGLEILDLEMATLFTGKMGNLVSRLSGGSASTEFALEMAPQIIRLGELYARVADKSGAINVFELSSMLPEEARSHAGYAYEFGKRDALTLAKLCNLHV